MNEARSVLGAICSAYDSFFEAEKKIADYIMEHKDQAVDMTVGELAKASGTSDATVSRFCRRCGFKGISEPETDTCQGDFRRGTSEPGSDK